MYREMLFPLLARLDSERAHNLTLSLLRRASRSPLMAAAGEKLLVDDPRLAVSAFGLRFSNPVGLAAGFDKNGLAVPALAALGFGHVEVGTVTPRPQPGRPRPRMFRLVDDEGIINRIGFANYGSLAMAGRLSRPGARTYILGINVGPNLVNVGSEKATEDYIACIVALHPYADYITINISSPNTQGLRLLQHQEALNNLLGAIFGAMEREGIRTPLLVKIAPDLDDEALAQMIQVFSSHPIAGIIATNTTLDRPLDLRSAAKGEAGGLSGRPLRLRSTRVIRALYKGTGGTMPIVGVGGIFTAADALEKIRAGATLVQLYSGMIYTGPLIARRVNKDLLALMDAQGIGQIADVVGEVLA